MVIVDTIYLNDDEVVVDKEIFNSLIKENKKFKKAVNEFEKLFHKDYSLHCKIQQKEYLQKMFKHIFNYK